MQCVSINDLIFNPYMYVHIHSPSGVFEFKVAEFSAQEEDADIDDDPVLDQGTGD